MEYAGGEIAVVGMACRFPDAQSPQAFWDNLIRGVESIRDLSDEELRASKESEDRLRDPRYVKRAAVLEDVDRFDAELFGFSPKEAAIADPQHRLFLETTWEALENAGWDPARFDGAIGLFGGCGMGTYFAQNILTRPDLLREVGLFLLRHTCNDKDFLVTRAAYLLDLQGPAVNVQTACSTSLVAVHMASQSLLSAECDMALAGGVTIELPTPRGYLPREGEILAPDGRVRAFDHRARGTVFGSGAGMVVLRRLDDALASGDRIHAVIRGTAVNNDGSRKVGYLAPSVEGQAAVMAEAHAVSEVAPETIGMVECHGTGTYMGDPIEVSALRQVFGGARPEGPVVHMGSVKTNIGHLDTAAGVAGLIKACLAVQRGQIPPSLNYERPNPSLEIEASPFRVPTSATEWPRALHPRRATVNSLGVGGTNAYAVVEQPPAQPPARPDPRPQLLVISGSGREAVEANTDRLADALGDPLADVSYTLLRGRRPLGFRRVVAARDAAEARQLLTARDPNRVFDHVPTHDARPVFLLPGGGSHHAGMGRQLLRSEPTFRSWMERADAHLRQVAGLELIATLESERPLEAMAMQLPAIYAVSFALARTWQAWGVEPRALIGHSLGENTAAALAGVFSFERGLELVWKRGSLFDGLPPGTMLGVATSVSNLLPRLPPSAELSVVNGPELCSVSGPVEDLLRLREELEGDGFDARRLEVPVAAHSRYVEPILDEFASFVTAMELRPPSIPIASNTTGTWLDAKSATDPRYWVDHLRKPVRFADGMKLLLQEDRNVFVETGPGRSLSSLARRQGVRSVCALPSMPHADDPTPEDVACRTGLGRAWAAGVRVDLVKAIHGGGERRVVDLPGYAFRRERHWIEPSRGESAEESEIRREPPERWTHRLQWREDPCDDPLPESPQTVLAFVDGAGLSEFLGRRLVEQGHRWVEVRPGDAYARTGPNRFTLAPEQGREGYQALIEDLLADGLAPSRVIHAWLVTSDEDHRPGSSFLHRNLESGFYSLFFLAQVFHDDRLPKPIDLVVLGNGWVQMPGEPAPPPEKATALGPVAVLPKELEGVRARAIDVSLPKATSWALGRSAEPWTRWMAALERELSAPESPRESTAPPVVALREGRRYTPKLVRTHLAGPGAPSIDAAFEPGGCILVTGGLGGIGLEVVEHLLEQHRVSVLITTRRSVPPRSEWEGPKAPDGLARLHRLDPMGRRTCVVSADVTDIEALQEAVQKANDTLGPIRGVFHAAGVVRDGLIAAKSQTDCEHVFAPKVFGTLVLERVLASQPLGFFAAFGSSSIWLTPPGQVDYAAANAFVDAFARSRHTPDRPHFAVHWGVWNQVGMAARTLEGTGEPEPKRRAADHPLLDGVFETSAGVRCGTVLLDPETHWVLDEHRSRPGRAVMPATGFMELLQATVRAFEPGDSVAIEDLFFSRPLPVADDEPREVRVELRHGTRGLSAEVRSRRRWEGQTGWELHAQARIPFRPEPSSRAPVSFSTEGTTSKEPPPGQTLRTRQEDFIAFGPRWRCVRRTWSTPRRGVAELELDPAFGESGWTIHPALLDAALALGPELLDSTEGNGLFVPVSVDQIRVHRPLPRRVWAGVELDPSHSPAAGTHDLRLDLRLADDDGTPLMEIDGLWMRRLATDLEDALDPPLRSGDWRPARAPSRADPAEKRLLHQYRLGIRPEEGPPLLLQALQPRLAPSIFISSMDLDELARTTAAGAREARARKQGEHSARPQLEVEFEEPRDGVERTLVAFWQELLGVEPVGVRDSFFDLGGHSLIAVRLFAKIRQAFEVDLPISALFEAPTVERCAELIRQGRHGGEGAADGSRRGRFLHLVPMHSGEPEHGPPLFLVAGMFGNVLNLRHLAHLVGQEQPIYGVQARGLFGDHQPHESFEAMARDYLAEIRQIQPHGPYLLGGFSGGGIAAWEMTRRLLDDGERVALLALLDTRLPSNPELTRREKAEMHLENLRREGPGYVAKWAKRRMRWELEQRRHRDVGEPEPGRFHDRRIEEAFLRALGRYQVPRLQDVPVVLFRPELQPAYRFGSGRQISADRTVLLEDNGWGAFCDGLRVRVVPGDHDSMVLEPNVRVLANRLSDLARAARHRGEARMGATGS